MTTIIKNFEELVKNLKAFPEEGNAFKIKVYNQILKALRNSSPQNTQECLIIFRENGMKFDGEENHFKKHGYWKSKILMRIEEIYETGTLAELREDPKIKCVEELSRIAGIGPAVAIKLYTAGIKSISDLEKNPEFLNEKQLIGLKYHKFLQERIPRKEMDTWNKILQSLFEEVLKEFKKKPGHTSCTLVGSYRRNKESSGDIDILISSNNQGVKLMREFIAKLISLEILANDRIIASGNKKLMAIAKIPGKDMFRHIDIYYFPKEVYPFALLFLTGSGEFNIKMRQHANSLGYSLNETCIRKDLGKDLINIENVFETEQDIFKFLKMEYLEPKDR